MVESIEFIKKERGQSEIKISYHTGEMTVLLFNSLFPIQASHYYEKAINSLFKQNPDLLTVENLDLFSVFIKHFWKYHLEAPLGIRVEKNVERIRIGKRIKEIREEKNIDAKTLSVLTGIDAANLCRIEQGNQSVGIDLLSKIANAMGYKVDFVKK